MVVVLNLNRLPKMKIVLLFVFLTVTTCIASTCKTWTRSYKDFLATKTPYRFLENKNDTEIRYKGCIPIKLWAIIRHGTRYPSPKVIVKMHEILPHLRDDIVNGSNGNDLCQPVLNKLASWVPKVNVSDAKDLAHTGEEEMVDLGERMQNRLPNMFPLVYSSHYGFRSTDTQRAIESEKFFLIGLFGRNIVNHIWPLAAPSDNSIIRFYKNCPRWKRDVDDNPLSLLERKKFEDTLEWAEMVKNISRRLGLDYVLDRGAIYAIYQTCAFETAWTVGKASPWCAIFTDHEFRVLEFAEDLEYYHIDGYGHPLNYLQACPAIDDMLLHLQSEDPPHASVSFSHSGTILKILAHLGLYNQSISHDFLNKDRLWRTSRIDAFASNIFVTALRCRDEDKFIVLHQERIVHLPGCPGKGLCPLKLLFKLHGGHRHCRFKEMCRIPDDEL